MRILHVDKFLYRKGGATGYMLDLAHLQREAGHVVDFFAMADDQRNIPATYEQLFPSHITLDPPEEGFRKRVELFARMLWSVEAMHGMDALADSFHPDVVHLHTIYHQLSPSILRPLARRGIPVVMTVHDSKLVCPTYARLDHGRPCDACLGGDFTQALRRRCKNDSLLATGALVIEAGLHRLGHAYSPVGIFICPSRFMESSMRVAGVFPDRLRHVPHFLESASLKSREGAGSGIVAVGRLSTEKGFDLLIDAMKLLPGEHLTIVGDGPLEQDLRNRALQVAAGRVTFAGRLNHEGVLACLQTARVAAVPSRFYENQPLTVIEAMGVGVAPVVTNLGGAPELVDHGVDGWISEPTSEKLAEALRVPLEDIDLAVAAGKAARARVVRDFDPSLHLSRIFAAYREAGLVAND